MASSPKSWFGRLQPWHVIALAGLVRAGLIYWADYQDRHLPVKYTDIDYIVFTDAARFVARGASPYRRATYRYSPLLAYLMLPNIWLHPAWGKVLFSAGDLVAAGLINYLLRRTATAASLRSVALAAWLFNPYTATISTRGSCDVLSVLLLLCLLACLLHGKPLAAGAMYGLAVHFRIYPVIYGPAILMFLARRTLALQSQPQQPQPSGQQPQGCQDQGEQQADGKQEDAPGRGPGAPSGLSEGRLAAGVAGDIAPAAAADMGTKAASPEGISGKVNATARGKSGPEVLGSARMKDGVTSQAAPRGLVRRGLTTLRPLTLFSAASTATFLLLAALFYGLYGNAFLNEAFLHHMTRKDPRHNFSPYYYPIYLSYGSRAAGGTSSGGGGGARRSAASPAPPPAGSGGGGRGSGGALQLPPPPPPPALPLMTSPPPPSLQSPHGAAAAAHGFCARMLTLLPLVREGWSSVRHLLDEPWRLAVLPQAAALLAVAARFHADLPAAWLLQTWAFVALNKVVTAQYFVWFLSLLPLALPRLAAQRAVAARALAAGGGAWVAAQLHWLGWAYLLEMRGLSVHVPLWVAGLLFQAANTWLVVLLARALRPGTPTPPTPPPPPPSQQVCPGQLQHAPPAAGRTAPGSGSGGSGGAGGSGHGGEGGGSGGVGVMSFLEASVVLARSPPPAAITPAAAAGGAKEKLQ